MGMLIDGKWNGDEDPPAEIGKAGNFQRVDSAFRDRVTADGSSGFQGRGRALSPLCRLYLPVGASHADLSAR